MNQSKPKMSFSKLSLQDLKTYFQIKIIYSETAFENWFNAAPKPIIEKEEKQFLKNLIGRHFLKLPSYKEEKLKAKFIIPILNKVDFFVGEIDDWYEVFINYDFEKVLMSGVVDYVVAQGTKEPETPYFFIQEFKSTKPDQDPEIQLLAQMIVALANNEKQEIWGSFIIGQIWQFAILKKVGESYQYYISKGFHALEFNQLEQIYRNLKTVKHSILRDLNIPTPS